jgi:outer membrane usher protein
VSLTVGRRARHPGHLKTASRLAGTALCLAALAPLPSWAQAQPPAAAAAAPTETIVVRVNLNTESKGDFFVQRAGASDFLVKVEDLKAMGIRSPAGSVQVIDGEPYLALKSMPGVKAAFDEKTLALNISAEPHLLGTTTLTAARAERRKGALVPATNSAFFNYALTGSSGSFSGNGLSVAAEAGATLGENLFLTDASTVTTLSGKKFVRLMSSVTRDDRENLRRIVVGDVLTPTRDFSSSVNLGGLSITKVYGLDPSFVRFPTQSLTGSVGLPSDMEVYLDGQRIRTERLNPGEFELRDILAYGGARNVQVVLRDAFGRVQQLNYSFYFSEQPLQPGLHEYSYNLGAMRRRYGTESNSYGPPALTMFHRYGLSNTWTLGWRAEAARDFFNTGPTATVVLGSAGVVSLALAASSFEGKHGNATLASYTFEARSWTMGLFLRHDGRNYASLADPPVMTNRRYDVSLSASYRLPHNASISVSHTALTTRAAPVAAPSSSVVNLTPRRTDTISYSQPLGSSTQLTASISRITDGSEPSRTEAFVAMNFLLDRNYSASTSLRADGNGQSGSARFTRNQPVGEGLGYDLSIDQDNRVSNSTQFRSAVQYNAPSAVVRAEANRMRDSGFNSHDERISLAGGIVAVGGHVAFSRPVTQSFALVKVGDVPQVGVKLDGLPVGKTGAGGTMVIPNVNAYYENTISIDPAALRMEYSLPAEVKRVSPSLRGGALVDFNVVKTQAFSGHLVTHVGGKAKPVEFAEIDLAVQGKSRKLPTGRGGEFYVENLAPGRYSASAVVDGQPCVFELDVPASSDIFIELGDVQCRPKR